MAMSFEAFEAQLEAVKPLIDTGKTGEIYRQFFPSDLLSQVKAWKKENEGVEPESQTPQPAGFSVVTLMDGKRRLFIRFDLCGYERPDGMKRRVRIVRDDDVSWPPFILGKKHIGWFTLDQQVMARELGATVSLTVAVMPRMGSTLMLDRYMRRGPREAAEKRYRLGTGLIQVPYPVRPYAQP